jgi:hypothetical protein
MRHGKRRGRQQGADQRPLHDRFGLRDQRERAVDLDLRRIERRNHGDLLGSACAAG